MTDERQAEEGPAVHVSRPLIEFCLAIFMAAGANGTSTEDNKAVLNAYLTEADKDGGTKELKLVLEKGAYVNAENWLGNAAAMLAEKAGITYIVKLLKEYAAGVRRPFVLWTAIEEDKPPPFRDIVRGSLSVHSRQWHRTSSAKEIFRWESIGSCSLY